MEKRYQSLKEFYPFYLTEHNNATCRMLHFVGTLLVVICFVAYLLTFDWRLGVAIPFLGYGFAWVGHFFFERNRPATFQYPAYSLASDFIMFWDLLTGKQKFNPKT